MRERSWRAAGAERAFIWTCRARTKPGASYQLRKLREIWADAWEVLASGRKSLGRSSRQPPDPIGADLWGERPVEQPAQGGRPLCWGWQEGGEVGAPGMPALRCERDSWSPSLPVLRGAQQQKRLIWARWGWRGDAAKFQRCADASSKMWASVRKKGSCPWQWGYLMCSSSEYFTVRKSL